MSVCHIYIQVMVEGKSSAEVTVNVMDVCSDRDCKDCCKINTGNKKYKLIDLERWPASKLLGFTVNKDFDSNKYVDPSSKGLRTGVPDVLPLCYKDIGMADKYPKFTP